MKEGKMYINTRTGEKSEIIKVMQSDWDTEGNPEKIKDFFGYMIPGIKDIQNGDIIKEL